MQSTKAQIVQSLGAILPTSYGLFLGDTPTFPCITYLGDGDEETISVRGFQRSTVSYQVTLWAKTVSDMETYSPQIDNALRSLGLKRATSYEATVNDLLTKVFTYEGDYEEYRI